MEKRAFLTIAAIVFMIAGGSWAGVIYVDDDAPRGGDGVSWATAHRYLQDGLAVAVEGDEVRVGQGLYKPDRSEENPDGTRDRAATFEVADGITLKGGFAGVGAEDPNACNTSSYPCVLSGDLNGDDEPVSDPCDLMDAPSRLDNVYHVVRLTGGVVEGVEVTAGYAHRYVVQMPFSIYFTTDHAGGGIWGNGTVRDCLIRDNYAEDGGGGLWYQGESSEGDEVAINIQQCRFVGNATRWYGGGMCLMYCQACLSDCDIQGNWAGCYGGGSYCSVSNMNVVNSRFLQNEAVYSGGGVNCKGRSSDYSTVIFDRCSFASNRAHTGVGFCSNYCEGLFVACELRDNTGNVGVGIFTNMSSLVLKNTLVHGNWGSEYGGAFCVRRGSSLGCQNCTIVNNVAPDGSFLAVGTNTIEPREDLVTLSNCVIRNDGQEIWSYDGDIQIDHTNLVVQRDLWYDEYDWIVLGEGNIETDPCFADPGYWDDSDTPDDPNDDIYMAGDYHLKSQAGRWDPTSESWVQDDVTSPCIDAGDPNSPIMYEPFPNGGIINMGAYGGTAEASKSYFGDAVCETIIAGDINGDCKVDLNDLLLLIRHWTDE